MSPDGGARRRPLVVEHSFGDPGSGGPISSLERVLDSDLSNRYEFRRMHQKRTTGGIDLARIREWARWLRKTRPDLVHVRGLGNEGFHGVLAARLAGCPRVLVSVHGTVRDLVNQRGMKPWVLSHALEPATLRLATHVTTVCDYAARRTFIARHADKLVGPIYNGVQLPPAVDGGRRRALRASWGVADGDVAVISVGRLTYEKGHRDLALALSSLPVSVAQRVVLVLVGDGPEAADIEQEHRRSGVRVRALGLRHDVPDLLDAADVFAFATLHENLSNALLEAMAHRLAVVATRVGGNTEVLETGAGVLVEVGNVAELTAALREVVTDGNLRHKLAEAARRRVEEKYSLDAMCRVLDEVYQEVLLG